MAKIVILGAGTWGSALSIMLAREGHDLTLWSAIAEELVQMNQSKKHKNLPGAILPDTLKTQPDLEKALEKKDLVVFAVPSIFIRETARKVSQVFARQKGGASEVRPLILCVSKGIEKDTNEILTRVIQEELEKDGNGPFSYIAVSGPTHAEEVAIGLPSCLVAASPDLAKAETVQKIFMNERMRVYTNPDMIGVELCGALKNIIALAAGMSDGSGFGDNAKAALITRGAAEMTRLGLAMGGSAETFAGDRRPDCHRHLPPFPQLPVRLLFRTGKDPRRSPQRSRSGCRRLKRPSRRPGAQGKIQSANAHCGRSPGRRQPGGPRSGSRPFPDEPGSQI